MINSSNFDFSIEFRNLNSAAQKLFNIKKKRTPLYVVIAHVRGPREPWSSVVLWGKERNRRRHFIYFCFLFLFQLSSNSRRRFSYMHIFFLFLGLLFLTCSIVLSLSFDYLSLSDGGSAIVLGSIERSYSEKREIIFASLPIFHFPSFSLKRPPRRILSLVPTWFFRHPSTTWQRRRWAYLHLKSPPFKKKNNNKTTKRIDTLEFYLFFFPFQNSRRIKKKRTGAPNNNKTKRKNVFLKKKKVVSLEKSDRNWFSCREECRECYFQSLFFCRPPVFKWIEINQIFMSRTHWFERAGICAVVSSIKSRTSDGI